MSADLLERVATVLGEHPDWTAAQVQRHVRARRADVLAAVQTIRGAQQSGSTVEEPGNGFPLPGNPVPTVMAARNAHSKGDATVRHSEEPEDYPTREDFEEVARMMRDPATRLLQIIDNLQRHAYLRATVIPTYDALRDLLDFTERFEDTLRGLAEQADRLHAELEPVASAPRPPVADDPPRPRVPGAPLPLPPRLPLVERGDVFGGVKGLAEPGA